MILGLDHVAVHCRDLDRSLAFYRDLLGIPVREEGELAGGSAAEITGDTALAVRFADLELGEGRTLELLERATGGRGAATHLALRVDDADAAFATLAAAGVELRSSAPVAIAEPGHWQGARAFYAVDPDGVEVELIAWPPHD